MSDGVTTGCRARDPVRWSVGGLLLESLAARDFERLGRCFEPTVTMRALLPRGAAERRGVDQVVGEFRGWFGGAEGFEVVDATVGAVGPRLHVAWRLRVHPTPGGDDRWHLVEQQAYLQATERIDRLDLLCTGFIPDDDH